MMLQLLVSMFVLAYMKLFAKSMNQSSDLQVHLSVETDAVNERRIAHGRGRFHQEDYVLLSPKQNGKLP